MRKFVLRSEKGPNIVFTFVCFLMFLRTTAVLVIMFLRTTAVLVIDWISGGKKHFIYCQIMRRSGGSCSIYMSLFRFDLINVDAFPITC